VSKDWERWLEAGLPALMTDAQPPPAPRYRALREPRPGWRLRLASVPAMVGSKLLVGAGAVALAAAGVGVKTAVTGSPSPFVWSHGAVPVVQQCKASATPGTAGIGGCVSTAVAGGHPGAAGSGAAASSPSDGASPSSTAHGRSTDHPTPHAHPTHPSKPTPVATIPPRPSHTPGGGQ
jgi:hypothetical protein